MPIVFGQHFPFFNVFPVSLVPKEEDGACDENGRKGAGKNSDYEDEGEIIDYPGAEDPKGNSGKECRNAGNDGPGENAVDGDRDDFPQVCNRIHFQFLAYAIENHDGIVNGIPDDHEYGSSMGAVN